MSELRYAIFFVALGVLLSGCASFWQEADVTRRPVDDSARRTAVAPTEPGAVESPDPFAGHWVGSIAVAGQVIGIEVDLGTIDGARAATLNIPAQGAFGVVLRDVVTDDSRVRFELPIGIPAVFDGRRDGESITGTFSQGNAAGTFELERTSDSPRSEHFLGRPVRRAAGDVDTPVVLPTARGELHGSLRIPMTPGPHPLVVMIAGSGPTDRDGNSALLPGRNDSLMMLAEALAENGVASLRYDKRGVAGSASAAIPERELRVTHFVDDAAGFAELMRGDRRFSSLTVLGHSEGALIGTMLAERGRVDGFIAVAGMGRTLDEVVREQLAEYPDALRTAADTILNELRAGRTVADTPSELDALFRPSVQPYLISVIEIDPAVRISRLTVPTLIVQGDRDLQVSVADAERLHSARGDADLIVITGMNHVLKAVGSDLEANQRAYTDPTVPIASGFVEALVRFVHEVSR